MRRVEVVKRLVVVSRARRLFAAQTGQRILVPENQMISEHSDRMVRVGIHFALRFLRPPLRLLGRYSRHGGLDWRKPLRFVMRAMKLRQEKRTECNRRRSGRGR